LREHWVGYTVKVADAVEPACAVVKQCWTNGCLNYVLIQGYDGSNWYDLSPTINHNFYKGNRLYYDFRQSPPPAPPAPPPIATSFPIGWRILPATDTGDMGDFWTVREFDVWTGGNCTGPAEYDPEVDEKTGPAHYMTGRLPPFSTNSDDGSLPDLAFDHNVETYHQGSCQTCTAKGAYVGFTVDPKQAAEGKCVRLRQCYGTGCAPKVLLQKTYDGSSWVDVITFDHAGPMLITYVDLTGGVTHTADSSGALYLVRFSLTCAGTVASFGATIIDAIAAQVATTAQVAVDQVKISVAAASVKLAVQVTTTSSDAASAASTALATSIATPALATLFLSNAVPSILVEEVEAPTVSIQSSSSSLSTAAIIGIAVGGGAALVLSVLIYEVISKSKLKNKSSTSTSST